MTIEQEDDRVRLEFDKTIDDAIGTLNALRSDPKWIGTAVQGYAVQLTADFLCVLSFAGPPIAPAEILDHASSKAIHDAIRRAQRPRDVTEVGP